MADQALDHEKLHGAAVKLAVAVKVIDICGMGFIGVATATIGLQP